MPGHKCKGKLFLFNVEKDCLVEMVDPASEVSEEHDGDMEISMHALSGSFNPRTIRLSGVIKGQQLSVLVDSGNTHKLGIVIRTLSEFRIFIGSRDFLTCSKVCPRVSTKIQETTVI